LKKWIYSEVGFRADPHLPLLVWIDDDESAIPSALEAAGQGITVLQLVSTAAVKKWVMINVGQFVVLP
jgi:hypothetical protein